MPIPPKQLRLALLRVRLEQARLEYGGLMGELMLVEEEQAVRVRMKRRWWVKPWIQRRVMYGQYDTLVEELKGNQCRGDFKAYMRMDVQMYVELLDRVTPHIRKKSTQRMPLEPGIKLAITLRYLATGDSYRSIAFNFRVAHNTISLFVPQVCAAITAEYRREVFDTPHTPREWQVVAERFGERWNYHHCCGAIDGKHIRIKKPKKSGSLYHNYKGFFSIVLLAVVDGDYKFLWTNVGGHGSECDAGLFNKSQLKRKLERGTLGLPPPSPLPGDNQDTGYFMVGDDAFALRSWMMKPISKRDLEHDEVIFNYRTSRARRVVENAFGILANRFRVLLTTIGTQPNSAVKTTQACLCLHNLMRIRYPGLQNSDLDMEDGNHNLVPGAWRTVAVMEELDREGRTPRENCDGRVLRATLKAYYNSPAGSVPWQEAAIHQ